MFSIHETEIAPAKRRAFDRLLAPGGGPKFVLGRNKYAESVARAIDVDGFLDDYTEERVWLDRPVVRTSALPADSVVVSCVVDGRPVTALDRLRQAGVEAAIDYFALLRLAPGRFRALDFSAHNERDLVESRDRYEWLHGLLADDRSREILRRVSALRLTGDVESMRGLTLDLEGQYFEGFVRLGPAPVFVDGGGFDGQTTRRFAERWPDYRRVYYVEPNPEMMRRSQESLGDLRAVTPIAKGLSDRAGTARFDAGGGPTSRLSGEGDTTIALARLDDEVAEPVDFIKLDIEGAEYDAVAGARRHIAEERPTLAICVYHDQRDFWRIPERVLETDDGYDVLLRHYTEGILETVMYFIPADRRGGRPSPP